MYILICVYLFFLFDLHKRLRPSVFKGQGILNFFIAEYHLARTFTIDKCTAHNLNKELKMKKKINIFLQCVYIFKCSSVP